MFDKFIEKKIVPGSDIDNRFKILINPPRDASVSFINALQDYVKNLNLSLKFNPNSYDFKNAFSEKELEIIKKYKKIFLMY